MGKKIVNWLLGIFFESKAEQTARLQQELTECNREARKYRDQSDEMRRLIQCDIELHRSEDEDLVYMQGQYDYQASKLERKAEKIARRLGLTGKEAAGRPVHLVHSA